MRIRDEEKENRIREKAIELIVKKGLDGFSMQKLARAAGVSPATIYIYYKDKEDLILQLSVYTGQKMMGASMINFDPDMSFKEGLHLQWKNRTRYFLDNKFEVLFLEQIRYTKLYDKVLALSKDKFQEKLIQFTKNAIANNEVIELPFEVYWSMAYAPLYQLIKFHTQGKSFKNSKFSLNEEVFNTTFDLVLKSLTPNQNH